MAGPTNSILPPNATAAERAIEAATARLADVPMPMPDVWNPDTCPEHLLPWLAWALSIDAWRADWPVTIKRSILRAALDVSRRKGTASSVRQVVEAFGGQVELREWWENVPTTTPHTFDMVLTLSGADGIEVTAQYVDDVIAEVSRTKPVRSHFNFTQGANAQGGIGIGTGARAAVYRRLQFDEAGA